MHVGRAREDALDLHLNGVAVPLEMRRSATDQQQTVVRVKIGADARMRFSAPSVTSVCASAATPSCRGQDAQIEAAARQARFHQHHGPPAACASCRQQRQMRGVPGTDDQIGGGQAVNRCAFEQQRQPGAPGRQGRQAMNLGRRGARQRFGQSQRLVHMARFAVGDRSTTIQPAAARPGSGDVMRLETGWRRESMQGVWELGWRKV